MRVFQQPSVYAEQSTDEGLRHSRVDVNAHFGGEGQVGVDTPSIELASLGDRDDPDMSGGAIRKMSERKSMEGEPSYLDIANIVLATLVAVLTLVSAIYRTKHRNYPSSNYRRAS
ncbi:hypothetical protein M422DRAFT_263660 [Sphaerobolus stellatus SS14]|uniref:Uncharacterized protein n=1 Tax=Sphaerobolus stellatus (strain SS14) TaxID=990650 RepID=A0A0C9VA53_SPHS4|nr:hypothetical protein M422DRAFT_263660 [Sphaerobolus stellatus SS14]